MTLGEAIAVIDRLEGRMYEDVGDADMRAFAEANEVFLYYWYLFNPCVLCGI